MKRSLLLGAFALGVLSAPVPAKAAVFLPQIFTLANGLQLVVVPNDLSPAVAEMVWIKVGSGDEKPGKTGLAHYLEHLMFRGTEKVPAGAFSATIAARGGSENAFTSMDYTAFHEIVAAKDLGLAMLLEADRMEALKIDAETATPELSVVLSERDERTDNKPEGLFAEKMRAALYPESAYGRPVIGTRADIEGLSPADAKAFYKAAYAPDNALVVLSGNVDARTAIRLADATFGRLKPRGPQKRLPLLNPKHVGASRVEMRDGRVKQPILEWTLRAPNLAEAGMRRATALEVLAELLAGGQVGVLFDELVRKEGIATGLDVDYDSLTRGPTSFSFTTAPRPGGDPYALEQALKSAFYKLSKKGFSPASVEEAKKRLERSAVFARDSLMAPCTSLGSALANGYPVSVIEEWPAHVRAVTASDVNAAFRALAQQKLQVTGLLLPDPDHPASGDEDETPNAKGRDIR